MPRATCAVLQRAPSRVPPGLQSAPSHTTFLPSRLRTFLDPPNSRQATAFLMSSLPKMLGAMRRWISASTSGRLANSWKAVISSLLWQGGWGRGEHKSTAHKRGEREREQLGRLLPRLQLDLFWQQQGSCSCVAVHCPAALLSWCISKAHIEQQQHQGCPHLNWFIRAQQHTAPAPTPHLNWSLLWLSPAASLMPTTLR